ncbi:Omp28-related outer membrane protein [Mangrovimonas sp. ST2L15]|uniref:Omp28-related outer membrane protein n=1 Tax=Mangrovimonas sp. ST2L15 TaxID=1645916 RepID=UPI000A626995|nr:Omp28-related outer membrane protein [Mangrovimonas sp. ST2L15]
MKVKQTIFRVFLFVLTGLMASCSSSSTDEGGGTEQASSITISSNASSVYLGESFAFTVMDNLGNNVTAQSTIYFNGNATSSANYTPSQGGTFDVYAKYNNLTSSDISVTVNVEETLSSIVLTGDKEAMVNGETITLTATGNEGTDFTAEATFFVNGVALEGNTYVASEYGNITFTASYDTYDSSALNVLVGHTEKVLIEDYTGTWCGWCPRVAYGIELVEEETENTVVVAIHRGNSSGSYYDPYNYPAEDLEDFIGLTGYPTAKLNRIFGWASPEPNFVGQVLNYQGDVVEQGLAITSNLNGSTLDVTVKINAIGGLPAGTKLVVGVLENGLVQDQTNYTSYYGGGSVLYNFEHNHVLRQMPAGLFGEEVSASDMDATSGFYSKEYSFQLSSSIQNSNNLTLAAFITNSAGAAINSQKATVGETKDFD